ncbi:MAG: MFS transporter [Rhodospirillaceae bacterium]|nr:MFS transporter [Rhodospirillaceae bacterium]
MTLFLAILATFTQQTLTYMTALVVPVAAPELAKVVGVPVAMAGLHMGLLYMFSSMSMLMVGGFIRKLGAVRMSQIALTSMGVGLALGLTGEVWGLALGAAIIGIFGSSSTPASSDILARFAPPKHAALIFSFKQTAVPMGGILAGILVPFLLINFGWQGIFYGTSAMCFTLAIVLQLFRRMFDQNRNPDHRISARQAITTLRGVLIPPKFRHLVYATFTYCGLQGIFAAFFVSYLVGELGFDLVEAGAIFALSQAASVVARIIWGWIVDRVGSARPVLAFLGVTMAVFAVGCALMLPGWGELMITLVAMGYSATAISWHGVVLAEVANLSTSDMVATNTGGVLAFAVGGQFAYPALMGVLLTAGGTFGMGFAASAFPALVVGLLFMRKAPD